MKGLLVISLLGEGDKDLVGIAGLRSLLGELAVCEAGTINTTNLSMYIYCSYTRIHISLFH